MANFTVIFQLKSYYTDESLNLSDTIEEKYEANDLDSLFEILDDNEEIENIDDTSVINMTTDDSPEEVNIEYVKIKDESGKEVYRDKDYNSI